MSDDHAVENVAGDPGVSYWRDLLDSSADAVIEYAPGAVVVWASPSVRTVLGWDPDEIVGKRFDAVAAEDQASVERINAEVVRKQLPKARYRVRSVCRDGSLKWTDTIVRYRWAPTGALTSMVAAIRDISDLVAAEDEVRQADQRLRLAMLHAVVGMAIVAPDGQFRQVNPALCQMLDRSEPDLLSATWQELTHPDDLKVDEDLVGDVLAGRRDSYRLRKRYVRPDGALVWGDLSVSCVREGSGEVRYFISQIADVTPTVIAEDTSRAVAASMLDPHIKLRAVRDSAGQVVDLVYTEANNLATRYLRTDPEMLIGSSVRELLGDGESVASVLRWCTIALDSRHPVSLDDALMVSAVRGIPRRFDVRVVGFGADSVSLTWRDVTERYEAARQLTEAEQHHRLLADRSTDVVVVTQGGVFRWLSPSLTLALGWAPDEWVGRGIHEFTHPDDLEVTERTRTEIEVGATRVVRVRLRHHDGTHHWVEVHAAPFADAVGGGDGIIASFRLLDDRVNAQHLLTFRERHDHLTGLLNRDEIHRRLDAMHAHEARTGTRAFLAIVDVDQLRLINEEHGHTVGDELLRVVAGRIRHFLREGDLVARVGGDELLVVLHGVRTADDARTLTHKLLNEVNRVHECAGVSLTPRISIGLTELTLDQDRDHVLTRAEQALRQAKQRGGNRVEVMGVRSP